MLNERDWGPGNPVWEDIQEERRDISYKLPDLSPRKYFTEEDYSILINKLSASVDRD